MDVPLGMGGQVEQGISNYEVYFLLAFARMPRAEARGASLLPTTYKQ
jgi:hypothetical protein